MNTNYPVINSHFSNRSTSTSSSSKRSKVNKNALIKFKAPPTHHTTQISSDLSASIYQIKIPTEEEINQKISEMSIEDLLLCSAHNLYLHNRGDPSFNQFLIRKWRGEGFVIKGDFLSKHQIARVLKQVSGAMGQRAESKKIEISEIDWEEVNETDPKEFIGYYIGSLTFDYVQQVKDKTVLEVIKSVKGAQINSAQTTYLGYVVGSGYELVKGVGTLSGASISIMQAVVILKTLNSTGLLFRFAGTALNGAVYVVGKLLGV